MTLTTYPVSAADSPDLTALSLSRLVHRLELNLLVPSADLSPLRQSEYQRMRVGAVRYSLSYRIPAKLALPWSIYRETQKATEIAISKQLPNQDRTHLTETRT